ncbi:ataxin-7-like protein 2b isoform X1 [Etheostoma cragini]|uniref:ataxin-7-like protein 2b isoform X1 n=1 Tax=Etheostoma cragini TaxID=417921 RepID=UPI00155DF42D|nr:ataxin-7-like protein 2b isoform X1 [Etheostoma cragini]
MAALDRRNPNLDDFVGLNWSSWVNRVNILPSDAGSIEDSSKYGSNRSETMTLRKEDMHTFGKWPAHDEIYLVVCSHCGQVVKPQAFEKHCERRHGPLPKMSGQSSTWVPQQQPCTARPLLNHSSSRERQKDGRCHEASAPASAASPVHQHRPSKAQKETASFPSVEKVPQENAPFPHHTSFTTRPKVPPWHSGPLPPGYCSSSSSPSERPSVQKPTAGQSSESSSPLRGTRTYSRVYKNNNKKECDLNKQCRVVEPEGKKLCSQERICNTDSIHQQQKASRRTKTFDQSAEEQKTFCTGQDREQLLVKSKDKEKHPEAFKEKITQSSKYCHIPSRSGEPSETVPEVEGDSTVEVQAQPQYPFNQSLLSGEESDYEQEEATDLPATPWHPKPLRLCTFGCRTLGCSIFTFDRRLQHLRFALSAMLEHHVSTHLWKKMPQVSSGLRSRHVTPLTVGSPVRTGVRPSNSTGSLSLESTSQLETKTAQHNSPSNKLPSSITSARLGPGQRRNPVGRASKARLREEELMQDASAAQKAAKLSHSSEDESSKYIRDPPLNEKGQPHVPSSQGQVNGTCSYSKKPCPPLHRPTRSRGRPPGIKQKVAGYEQKGLAQKRKGSNESPPLGSSLSRTSKCQHSGTPMLWAWRKDQTPEDQ